MRRVKTVPQNKLSSFDFESGDEVLLDKIRNVTTEKFRCDRACLVGKICSCPGWDSWLGYLKI